MDFPRALRDFDQAVKLFLDCPGQETDGTWEQTLAFYVGMRGDALNKLGRDNDALADRSTAIALKEREKYLKQERWSEQDEYEFMATYARRGWTYGKLGARKEHLEDYDRCIAGKEALRAKADASWERDKIDSLARDYTSRGLARDDMGNRPPGRFQMCGYFWSAVQPQWQSRCAQVGDGAAMATPLAAPPLRIPNAAFHRLPQSNPISKRRFHLPSIDSIFRGEAP